MPHSSAKFLRRLGEFAPVAWPAGWGEIAENVLPTPRQRRHVIHMHRSQGEWGSTVCAQAPRLCENGGGADAIYTRGALSGAADGTVSPLRLWMALVRQALVFARSLRVRYCRPVRGLDFPPPNVWVSMVSGPLPSQPFLSSEEIAGALRGSNALRVGSMIVGRPIFEFRFSLAVIGAVVFGHTRAALVAESIRVLCTSRKKLGRCWVFCSARVAFLHGGTITEHFLAFKRRKLAA